MILCGNKCDLSDARVISKERAQLLALEYGTKFMETSAQASINVEEVLIVLLLVMCNNIDSMIIVSRRSIIMI